MWLIRFHLIETRDYNRLERFCRAVHFAPKKFSAMVLMKGILLYVFQKKSWRQVGSELNIPHLPIYNFYSQIQYTREFRELLIYFIERRIALSLLSEKTITREYLKMDDVVERSREELEILLSTLSLTFEVSSHIERERDMLL